MPGLPVSDDLALEGGLNFRDLGGATGADGRRVRRGRIYRSGTMSDLTAADQARLAALGIRTVFDLRSNRERERMPFAPAAAWPVSYWSRDYLHSGADTRSLQERADEDPRHTREMMVGVYRRIAYEQADSYRALFAKLAAGELPLVFNCAAGKDRTGVAAILLLDALGVSREAVLADYLATNRVVDQLWDRLRTGYVDDKGRAFWEPLFSCETGYVDAFYETLARDHGSLSDYRAEVLGVDAAMIAALRGHLLEPLDAA